MANERGRPRTFDLGDKLDAALSLFWRQGFLGTSLSELTDVMGINKPSLYAAYGDKQGLYLRALNRYAEQRLMGPVLALDANADGRAAMHGFLVAMAALFAGPAVPGGCFVVNGSADLRTEALPAAVDDALRQALQGNETTLRLRLARAAADGQLDPRCDVEALAGFFFATVAGMSVLAKGGASADRLRAVADAAMGAWVAPVG